ncbi:Radical SAM superfamily enzyme [Methanonatronarchaeum thermophilum]|uniref:Radical SAM superfamily enzyme n=1 Tax=Methanonatronarchaeum thermophilum TaxID=1927129 RepID=A0A1Y3GGS7_9EURY|nr:radical SAM protein [Methanonatronarchaeum thermophilum]OUJ19404.1 Radical SAM superfamily enzyme [Methanonatronarchaeum thermophilum]
MPQEFIAYKTKAIKLKFIRKKDGSIDIVTEGPLSPFLGSLRKKLKRYVWGMNSHINEDKLILSTGFPPIPSLAFENMVKTEIKRFFGINRPQNLTIMVTGNCQCNCQHCLVGDMINKQTKELPTRTIKKTIDQAIELGVSQILFEGGEPTLRDDLTELVGYVGNRASTMVVTNGLEIDQKLANRLDNAGLDYLNFSLDSPYPEIHNKFRQNKNAFNGVIEGLKSIENTNITSAILYVATPENSEREKLEDLIELCREHSVFELMIEEVVDTGNWSEKQTITDQRKKEISQLQRELVEKEERFITRFYRLREPDCFGCFAGKRWLYMSPEGEIMPCMHTPISFGNIKKQNLKKIWKKIRRHHLYRKNKEKCVYETQEYKKSLENIPKNKTPPYKPKYFKR